MERKQAVDRQEPQVDHGHPSVLLPSVPSDDVYSSSHIASSRSSESMYSEEALFGSVAAHFTYLVHIFSIRKKIYCPIIPTKSSMKIKHIKMPPIWEYSTMTMMIILNQA